MRSLKYFYILLIFVSVLDSSTASADEKNNTSNPKPQGFPLEYYINVWGECKATIARFEDQDLNTKALIFSAGHCYGGSRNENLRYDGGILGGISYRDVSGRTQLLFRSVHGGIMEFGDRCYNQLTPHDCLKKKLFVEASPASLNEPFYVRYSNNFLGHDILIGQLPFTYNEIMRTYGVSVPVIAKDPPNKTQTYFFASNFDENGFIQADLRMRTCKFDQIGKYQQNLTNYSMQIEEAFYLQDCLGVHGESGSPIYGSDTNLIYGVASSIIPEQRKTVLQRLDYLRPCFENDFNLNVKLPGCPLPFHE